ncbi:MAG: hypothetical protein ACRETW_07935 [Stenotrophobium sp.]
MSTTTFVRLSACSIPTCTAPRLPPPLRTIAVFGFAIARSGVPLELLKNCTPLSYGRMTEIAPDVVLIKLPGHDREAVKSLTDQGLLTPGFKL